MKPSEEDLIQRIRRQVPSSSAGVKLGIGDDAAVIRPKRGSEWALSCDQFVEGIHFFADVHPPEVVGYKALARATSDLAAMGARPSLFLMSLTLPARRTGRWFDRMLNGLADAARSFGMTIAGGDTTCSPGRPGDGDIAFSITVLGDLELGRAIRRRGARAGDALYVTGQLGAAQLGLEIVLRGLHRQSRWKKMLAAHNHPRPCIEIGQWLARHRLASAMIDLSDGLSTDLMHLCQASGVSASIIEKSLPMVSVPEALQTKGIDGRTLALHGGEDYGLLFTVHRSQVSRVPPALLGTKITRIGDIVTRGSAPRIQLVSADGSATPLLPGGWNPFARGRRGRA